MLEFEQQITALTTIKLSLNVSSCLCTRIPSEVQLMDKDLAVSANYYSSTDLNQKKIHPFGFSGQSIKPEK